MRSNPRNVELLRKRQELDAAMEEELHQIVRKAGQAYSGPWRKADQLPVEEANRAPRSEHLPPQLDAEVERKRQELGAAREEELREIFREAALRKADQLPVEEANSAARSEHLPAELDAEAERNPQELGAARDEEPHEIFGEALSRRSSWPWIMALVVLILALSGVGYQALRKSQMAELKPAAESRVGLGTELKSAAESRVGLGAELKPAAESRAGLGLKVEMKKDLVHVSWDKNNPLIASAKSGVLSVRDGPFQNDLGLDVNLLSRGSVNYYQKTADVTFHLQVVTDDRKTTSEVVQVASGNQANTLSPTPISVDLYPHRVGPIALLDNSKGSGSRASAVPTEVPSIKRTDTGRIEGVLGLVPQGPGKTARHPSPRLSPMAISADSLQGRKPAPQEGNTQALTALNLAKPGVPKTWKLVVEYLGLTPLVSAKADVPLHSSSPPTEGSPREEDTGAIRLQPVPLPSDEPARSLPKEKANDVRLAQERPVTETAVPLPASALRDSAVAPPQAIGTDSVSSALVQCPENSDVREIPFASGRPDRKTVVCGEAVTIIRESGDWVRIRTLDGFEGHILRRFVK